MSIASVSPVSVHGLTPPFLATTDTATVLYAAGSNIVLLNRFNGAQKFIAANEAITAGGVSSDKHYLAFAERTTLCIYDVVTLRKPTALEGHTINMSKGNAFQKAYNSIAFTSDSKQLLSLLATTPTETILLYYTWEKQKLLAYQKFSIHLNNATADPAVTTSFAASGDGVWLGRYTEGKITGSKINDGNAYTNHLWLPNSQLLLTTAHEFIIATVSSMYALSTLYSLEVAVSQICATPTGFIIASPNKLQSYTLKQATEDGKESFSVDADRVWNFVEDTEVVALTLTEEVIAVTNDRQMWVGSYEKEGEEKRSVNPLKSILPTADTSPIIGLDICLRRPILATVSADRVLRLYNYKTRLCELSKMFSEDIVSVALHPSGLYILLGGGDKVRLLAVLVDDVKIVREINVRGGKEARFAYGGHLFAVATSTSIYLFPTFPSPYPSQNATAVSSFDPMGILNGHNGKIKSLSFFKDDSCLVSAATDGAIYVWSLSNFKREGEHILKGCGYMSAVPLEASVYAVGTDKMIKEIRESAVVREIESDVGLTQIVVSHSGKMMFVGTVSGTIRSIKFPFVGDAKDFQEHRAHAGPVSRLRISYDDKSLFSVGEDGLLYEYSISDREDASLIKDTEIMFADEVLVTKSDLEERTQNMQDLKARIDELKLENEYQLRLRDMTFSEKIKELNEKFITEMDNLKVAAAILRVDVEKKVAAEESEITTQRERQNLSLHEREASNNTKLMTEYEKYQALQQKTHAQQQKWDHQFKTLENTKIQDSNKWETDYESRLRARETELHKLQEEYTLQLRECKEISRQNESDIDTEIGRLQTSHEQVLRIERENGLRLKGENGIMRKKFNTLHKDIEENQAEIQRMEGEHKKLSEVIKNLEKQITDYRKVIQERDELIQEREKKVYELKKNNQELEKFKFVLDYKIKELKKQIEPRENQISGMNSEIAIMDGTLQESSTQEGTLESSIESLKDRLEAAKQQATAERRRIQADDRYMRCAKSDLTEAIEYIQEPQVLYRHAVRLQKRYAIAPSNDTESGDGEAEAFDVQAKAEFASQRDFLEQQAASIRAQLAQNQKLYKEDNLRMLEQNQSMITEINALRREVRSTQKSAAKILSVQKLVKGPDGKGRLQHVATTKFSEKLPKLDDYRPVTSSPIGHRSPSPAKDEQARLEKLTITPSFSPSRLKSVEQKT